jgi:hypothetical protein
MPGEGSGLKTETFQYLDVPLPHGLLPCFILTVEAAGLLKMLVPVCEF